MRPIIEIGHGAYVKALLPDRTTFVAVDASDADNRAADLVLRGADALLRGRLATLARLLSDPATRLVVCRIHQRPGRIWALLRGLLCAHDPLTPSGVDGAARLISGFVARPFGRRHRPALAVLDFEDEDAIAAAHLPLLRAAAIVFKRELPVGRWAALRAMRGRPGLERIADKLAPLPLGLPLSFTLPPPPATTRRSDVFFAGSLWPEARLRRDGLEGLAVLRREGLRIDRPGERLDAAAYRERCAAAWLTWSPPGLGWDCFRHYEAAALGSVPVLSYPTIERHAGARAGETAILYDPQPGGLASAIRAALGDPDRLRSMAVRAQDRVLEHHTPAAIVRRILRLSLPGREGEALAAALPPHVRCPSASVGSSP